jgi:hypothetical protein
MRNNIDALVERMRAVAMADNRPTTPGSHIDWAGDDDNSLPDLDDWGVTTGTSTSAKDEEVSPFIEDGSKPLPDPAAKRLTPPPSGPSVLTPLPDNSSTTARMERSCQSYERERVGVPAMEPSPGNPIAQDKKGEGKLGVRTSPASQLRAAVDGAKATQVKSADSTSTPKSVVRNASVNQSSSDVAPVPHISPIVMAEVKVSLHPSLPPKPVAAMERLAAQARTRDGVTTAQMHPSTPSEAAAPAPISALNPEITIVREGTSSVKTTIDATCGATDSPRVLKDFSKGMLVDPTDTPKCQESLLVPNHLSTYVTPSASRAYNATHSRNHTLGSLLPQTAPPYASNQRFSRSGASTPGTPSHYHTRTHSTPPPASFLNREPHTRRPVITGDAISRLARTIGKSRTTASVSSKE